ncbi:MAG: helicase [Anaerolineales bacterium]|nr:MAG: helicase [Anaerolineales bacterium]
MPHDIIDNRSRELAPEINNFLADSIRAHFAVGYFFLSGFQAIAEHIPHLDQLRLLIGNVTNRQTIEQLAEGTHHLATTQRAVRREWMAGAQAPRIRAETADSIQTTLELMDQTDDTQALVLSLADLIAQGKMQVRVYTRGRLHAKAYLFDFDPARIRAQTGAAIVGSSNLSLGGVTHNTELNVRVFGDGNHADLSRWFNELWDEAEDFDESLMHELRRSWATSQVATPEGPRPVSPHDIYLKTLYTLVKDRLEGRREAELLWEAEMPELADFQRVAVRQAIKILDTHNGVFVADVVGLGKTYIGTTLLKHYALYRGARPLVVCPASLVEMWEWFMERYQIDAPVISMGLLSQKGNERMLTENWRCRDRDLVLVDESQNFRYRDTQRYAALQLFTQTRPTILLTATPRATSAWDIYHQIKLWHPQDTTAIPINPPNLPEFFRKVEPRNEDPPSRDLQEVLNHILIRRTRRHVRTYYPDAQINGQPLVFPDRELETITYSIEETYRGPDDTAGESRVYKRLHDLMGQLTYARYALFDYVLAEHQDEPQYQGLQRAGAALRGLMRVMLFKRFESSVHAFRQTVNRLRDLQRAFQGALDRGLVPAGDEATDILYKSDLDDEPTLYDALEKASIRYPITEFDVPPLQAALDTDIALLDEMARLVEPIGPEEDNKLQQLLAMMTQGRTRSNRSPLPGDLLHSKVLIFTQYADTAHYLYDNLKHLGRIRAVESDTKDRGRIILRFAPKANNYQLTSSDEELRILVSTDVLSEGLNLQDANHVINYDLHWNPVRLIQRVGRVDRIGTEHSTIYAYNFLPETGLERELGIEQRLKRRITEIHRTIGEDAPVLHKSEQINKEALYAIYRGDPSVLEDEPEADIFNLLEAEELIRQLQRTDPDRFQQIATLPDGVRSARQAADDPGLFVFCQAGSYQRLYLVDEEGHRTADPQQAIRAIRCQEDEATLALPDGLNERIAAVKRDFDAEVRTREAEIRHTVGSALGRDYALSELRLVFEAEEDAEEKDRLALLSEIFTAVPLTARAHRELNTLRRGHVVGQALVAQLLHIVRDYNLEEAYRVIEDRAEEAPLIPRIVCSEALL